MNNFKKIVSLLFILWLLQSCVSVKEYQKAYLNDSEMELAPKQLDAYESSFQSYREGASGASGGSVGGGCGCN